MALWPRLQVMPRVIKLALYVTYLASMQFFLMQFAVANIYFCMWLKTLSRIVPRLLPTTLTTSAHSTKET